MFTKTGTPYIDNLNCIALTSRLHLDVGGYDYRPDIGYGPPGFHPAFYTVPQNLDSGINARRARIGVIGTFQADWVYSLIYDMGGSSDGFTSSYYWVQGQPFWHHLHHRIAAGPYHVRNPDRLFELPGLEGQLQRPPLECRDRRRLQRHLLQP